MRLRSMQRLSPEGRVSAVGQWEANVSLRQIEKKNEKKRLDCTHRTITRLAECFCHTNSTADHPRSGRPRVTAAVCRGMLHRWIFAYASQYRSFNMNPECEFL